MDYQCLLLQDYLSGRRWPQTVPGSDYIEAAMAFKKRTRTKSPCAVVIWEANTYWNHLPDDYVGPEDEMAEGRYRGQVVHVERYQAHEPRTTRVWWNPDETKPHPWTTAGRKIVRDWHRGGIEAEVTWWTQSLPTTSTSLASGRISASIAHAEQRSPAPLPTGPSSAENAAASTDRCLQSKWRIPRILPS